MWKQKYSYIKYHGWGLFTETLSAAKNLFTETHQKLSVIMSCSGPVLERDSCTPYNPLNRVNRRHVTLFPDVDLDYYVPHESLKM